MKTMPEEYVDYCQHQRISNRDKVQIKRSEIDFQVLILLIVWCVGIQIMRLNGETLFE